MRNVYQACFPKRSTSRGTSQVGRPEGHARPFPRWIPLVKEVSWRAREEGVWEVTSRAQCVPEEMLRKGRCRHYYCLVRRSRTDSTLEDLQSCFPTKNSGGGFLSPGIPCFSQPQAVNGNV